MRKKILFILPFLALSLLTSCNNKKETSESEPEIDIVLEEGEVFLRLMDENKEISITKGYPGEVINDYTKVKKEGHKLVGWTLKDSLNTVDIPDVFPSHNLTLYAKWEKKQFFFHFRGYPRFNYYYSYGDKLPSLEKPFAGWKVEGSEEDIITEVIDLEGFYKDVYVDPVFASKSFTINLKGSDKLIDFTPKSMDSSDIFTSLPKNLSTVEGHYLKGWSYKETFDDKNLDEVIMGDSISSISSNGLNTILEYLETHDELDLYPVVSKKTYKIEFLDYDSKSMNQESFSHYDEDEKACIYEYGDDLPTQEEYLLATNHRSLVKSFNGWSTSHVGGINITPENVVSNVQDFGENNLKVRLTASANSKHVKINFFNNDPDATFNSKNEAGFVEEGEKTNSKSFFPGDSLPMDIFIKDGWNLVGWVSNSFNQPTKAISTLGDFEQLFKSSVNFDGTSEVTLTPVFSTDSIRVFIHYNYSVYQDAERISSNVTYYPSTKTFNVYDQRFPEIDVKGRTYIYLNALDELPRDGYGGIEVFGIKITGWRLGLVDNESLCAPNKPTKYIFNQKTVGSISINDFTFPTKDKIQSSLGKDKDSKSYVLTPVYEVEKYEIPLYSDLYKTTLVGTVTVSYKELRGNCKVEITNKSYELPKDGYAVGVLIKNHLDASDNRFINHAFLGFHSSSLPYFNTGFGYDQTPIHNLSYAENNYISYCYINTDY